MRPIFVRRVTDALDIIREVSLDLGDGYVELFFVAIKGGGNHTGFLSLRIP
jgi:hypothetical protein